MFHSCNSPVISVKMNTREINVHVSEGMLIGRMGRGRRTAISTSKIKKMIAIIKKRKEKGIREPENGENPHSKGEVFSRSRIAFFLRRVAVKIIIKAMIKIKVITVVKIKISFPGGQIFSLEVRDNVYIRKEGSPSVNGNE